MESSTDYFISVVECNRIIYDKSLSDFKNAIKKEEAWARIAKATNTTVQSVKKRYISLRQKYCREKQKDELNIRAKRKSGTPWIYAKRLKFLDDFIKPRTTYTNDFNFENSQDVSNDANVENTDELALDSTEDVTDQQPDNLNEEIGHSEILQTDLQSISYSPEDIQRNVTFEFIDDPEVPTSFFSQYSGEFTQYEPPLERDTSIREPNCGNQSSEPRDSNTSKSPLPEALPAPIIAQLTAPLPNQTSEAGGNSDAARPQLQQEPGSGNASRPLVALTTAQGIPRPSTQTSRAATTSAAASSSRNLVLAAAGQVTRNQPSRTSKATSAASSSTNDKTMDNIRHKMDSCLTAISAKVAEKQQRTPHAPFLAYLGTKLPNVPKENMPVLEKEILNLVDSFCQ